jgi:hypothetical protein
VSARDEERQLWRHGPFSCVMVSCCSGAELQVRKSAAADDEEIVLRELYPTKSDLYERARELADEYSSSVGAGLQAGPRGTP